MSSADAEWLIFLSSYLIYLNWLKCTSLSIRIIFVLCVRKFLLLHSVKTLLHCGARFVYRPSFSAVIVFFFFPFFLFVAFKTNKCYFQLNY